MRKAWIAALALTGALTMGMTAMAESSGEAPTKPAMSQVFVKRSGSGEGYMGPDVGYSGGHKTVEYAGEAPGNPSGAGEGAGYAAAAAGVVPADADKIAAVGGFLDPMDLGNQMKYVPYPMGDLAKEYPNLKSPVGQLQVKKHGITMTADVINGAFPKSGDMGQLLSGLFDKDKEGNPSAEGTFKVMLFNQMLEKAPTVVNQKILESIAQIRKQTGEPVPFSIAHVEFRSVESLHLVKTERMVYTTGTRVLAYFDGWVFPMYVKAFVWQDGDNYRFVGIFAGDSQKDAALEAGGAMMEKIVNN